MEWRAWFVLVLMFAACRGGSDTDVLTYDVDLSAEKANHQRKVVGQLSGNYVLPDSSFVNSRWSEQERKKAAVYLKALIRSLGIEPVAASYRMPNLNPAIDMILSPFSGTNVYGILPSTTGSKEYVVLGAHYDTGKRGAPGAIDNATGIALVYSVMRTLANERSRKKNIVMVFFDQEEEELIGSRAFGEVMLDEQWNVHSIHCFDMVGWDGDGDRAMEVFSASESLLKMYRSSANAMNIPLKEIRIDPVGYDQSSTDFDAFVPLGFNVIGAGECFYHRDSTPYKDSAGDTFETVDFDYLLSCTRLIERVVTEIVVQ